MQAAIQSSSSASFQQWQCEYSDNGTVLEMVAKTTEFFDTVGLPSWVTKKQNYANCFQRGLKQIPRALQSDVRIMNLGQNSIARIWKNDFASYPSLVAVSIINNCVGVDFYDNTIRRCSAYFSIEAGAFYNLKNLTYLALDGNVMKHLPEMLSKSLLILFASTSSLGPVEKTHVQHLTSLEIVSFSTNCIGGDLKHFCRGNFTISDPVFSSSNLKFLDVSYNNFTRVPNYLFQQSLLGIKLRGNPIHQIHSQDFNNSTDITYLNVAWTSQYTKQPLYIDKGALGLLNNLQTLHLGGNMIFSLPESFLANNSKLMYLNLGFNCLKFIETNPQVLPVLPLLEELYVPGNSFCTNTLDPAKNTSTKLALSDSYARFSNLTTLAIGMVNPIPKAKFPSEFFSYSFLYGTIYDQLDTSSLHVLRKLSRFKKLTITTSGIRVLDTSAFSKLNLTYLDLSYNRVGETNKPKNIHYHNQHYESQRNKMSVPTSGSRYSKRTQNQMVDFMSVFADEETSKVVILSRNTISDLKRCPLKYMPLTTHLDLSYNEIHYINKKTFQSLLHLKMVDLQFNPIRHIHPKALVPLAQLADVKFNFIQYYAVFSLNFLLKIHHDLSLRYGDIGFSIYRMLLFYGNNSMIFPSIVSLDVSHVTIPVYWISTDQQLFKSLPNLTTLKMDGAHLPYHPQSNFFHGISKLKKLSMSDCWLEHFPYNATKKLHNLSYLDLSRNKIEILDKELIPKLPYLKTLILSYNFIHTITPGTLQLLQANGLTNIDLKFNQIEDVGPAVIGRNVLKNMWNLDLRGNPIHCECSLTDTFGWLVYSTDEPLDVSKIPGFLPDCSYSVINYYGGCLVCSNIESDQLLSLFTYSITQNCQEEFLVELAILFVLSSLICLLVPLICTNERLQKKITDSFFRNIRLRQLSETEDEEETPPLLYIYDGFVYCDKDDTTVGDWVDKVLVPRLQSNDHQFHIAVVGRDDWCGSTQVQQVLLKMKASRKTIVIISNNFLSSPQCQYVLSVLEQWTYEFKRKSCIILSYGDEACPSEIVQRGRRRNPYTMLRYSTASENCLFWSLLTHAMTFPST